MNKSSVNGLTDREVAENRKKYGTNVIGAKKENTFLSLLFESLGDPIIKILLIALAIKTLFLFQDFNWYETLGIVIAIFVASFISSLSEYGSEKAFLRLQEESSKINCRVKRNGKILLVPIDEIVVGDLVCLGSGDKIPADGYLISGELSVDESSLNGETQEVYKSIQSSNNKVFRGTIVYNDEAVMRVTAVGDSTVYGKLACELQEKQPESPLKLRLKNLARMISKIGYFSSALVSISYLFSVVVLKNNFDGTLILDTVSDFPLMFSHLLHALTLCVTIIVVAVPEGLPMMITLVLSSNMKRMLKDNVLVRRLVGIETAGSLNVLFTDKTGTLTNGNLEVVGVLNGNLEFFNSEIELGMNSKFYELVKYSLVYNNASCYEENTKQILGGNITDRALLSFVKNPSILKYKVVDKVAFTSHNKFSAVRIDDRSKTVFVKGAPEKLLSKCKYYYNVAGDKKLYASHRMMNEKIAHITQRGMRVLALVTHNNNEMSDMTNSTLVGIVAIKDEVRSEAIEGIKLVDEAGIQTVMVTGDNKDTAVAIAKEVGILKNEQDLVLTSDEMNKMTDDDLLKKLPNLKVVARSLPQDKSRLVSVCKKLNLVVGMTGDGVNDATALKKADVGFAMGSGTEVAKEASDIVILDDNFLSISKAILFGRTVFKSIRKFIVVQLTINVCAISLSVIGPFIGIPTPVTVVQMLWVNMVMDTLAGLAFAYEPPLIEYMKEQPKRKDEAIINKYMVNEIFFTGLYSAFLCLAFLKVPLIQKFFKNDSHLMTAFFGLFIFIDIFNSLNARTSRLNILENIGKNKMFSIITIFVFVTQVFLLYFGGDVFRTYGLSVKEFLITFVLASTVIPFDWARKMIFRRGKNVANV